MMSPERDRQGRPTLTEFIQQEERVLAGISKTVELVNKELEIQQTRSAFAIREAIGQAVSGVVGPGRRHNVLELFTDPIRTSEIAFLAFQLNGGRFTVPDYKNIRILTNTEGELALLFDIPDAQDVIRHVTTPDYLQVAKAIAPILDDYRENPDLYNLRDVSKIWGHYRGQLVKANVIPSPVT